MRSVKPQINADLCRSPSGLVSGLFICPQVADADGWVMRTSTIVLILLLQDGQSPAAVNCVQIVESTPS